MEQSTENHVPVQSLKNAVLRWEKFQKKKKLCFTSLYSCILIAYVPFNIVIEEMLIFYVHALLI